MDQQGERIDASLGGASASSPPAKKKKQSPAQPWKKPPGFPKRYLSAYNLFFKQERERLLKGGKDAEDDEDAMPAKPTLPDPNAPKNKGPRKHARSSGIGFANLARIVAKKWKNLDPEKKAPFEEVALRDKERYKNEMVVWRAQQEQKKQGNLSANDKTDTSNDVLWSGNTKVDPLLPAGAQRNPSLPVASVNDTFRQRDTTEVARIPPGRPHLPPLRHQDPRNPSWSTFGAPLPPESKAPASKDAAINTERYGQHSAHFSDGSSTSAFNPNNPGGRRPEDDYYRYSWWEGYDPRYRYDQRYDRNYFYAPYAVPYATGAARQIPPGMYYRGLEGGRPLTAPQRHLPVSAYPHSGLSSYSFDGHMAAYPQGTTSRHHDNLRERPRAKVSSPRPPTPPPAAYPRHSTNGKSATSTHPEGYRDPRRHNSGPEETWERPASRDHFEPPGSNNKEQPSAASSAHAVAAASVSGESESKRSAIAAAASDSSQPLSLKQPDGSEFETDETNLDNDTVDFLTTLELE